MSLDRPHASVAERLSLRSLHDAVADCRACDVWEGATRGVMGEGATDAGLMLVGEQPGDREDIEGHPFVGPAGRVLDQGLERAGIARDDVYMTLTTHPSAILRADEAEREEAMDMFVADLREVARWLSAR